MGWLKVITQVVTALPLIEKAASSIKRIVTGKPKDCPAPEKRANFDKYGVCEFCKKDSADVDVNGCGVTGCAFKVGIG